MYIKYCIYIYIMIDSWTKSDRLCHDILLEEGQGAKGHHNFPSLTIELTGAVREEWSDSEFYEERMGIEGFNLVTSCISKTTPKQWSTGALKGWQGGPKS